MLAVEDEQKDFSLKLNIINSIKVEACRVALRLRASALVLGFSDHVEVDRFVERINGLTNDVSQIDTLSKPALATKQATKSQPAIPIANVKSEAIIKTKDKLNENAAKELSEEEKENIIIQSPKIRKNAFDMLKYNEKKRRVILKEVKEEELKKIESNQFEKEDLKQAAKLCKPLTNYLSTTTSVSTKISQPVENYAQEIIPRLPGGFKNHANYCYLNSTLQVILRQPEIANKLLAVKAIQPSVQEKENTAVNKADKLQDPAFLSFTKDIINYINSKSSTLFNATRIIDLICQYGVAQHFKNYRQQDAFEFLQYFLDTLEKEIGTKPVYNLFGCELKSKRICKNCNHSSESFALTTNLTLAMTDNKQKHLSLQQLIDQLTGKEDCELICESCKEGKQADLITNFVNSSRYLILNLNRFVQEENQCIKNLADVFINQSLTVCSKQYELVGCVEHHGLSMNSGHYIAYTKETKNCWLCLNDEIVTRLSLQEILETTEVSKNVYVLLFHIIDES